MLSSTSERTEYKFIKKRVSEIALCEENAVFPNITAGGTYRYHQDLNV
jgi:hypothetical protein